MTIATPQNERLLSYLGRSGDDRALLASPRTVDYDAYVEAGSHPDVVERVWDELGAELPEESRCLVLGRPALVHAVTGTILSVALGTSYAMRLLPGDLERARAVGCETVHRYASTGTVVDVAEAFGGDWVFGCWCDDEPAWCLAAHRARL